MPPAPTTTPAPATSPTPITAPAPTPTRAIGTAGLRRRQLGAHRHRSERAEGVISTAIAVLIVAFLGIALWTGFDAMMNSATERTRAQVEQIGG